jgi:hypothetical protein
VDVARPVSYGGPGGRPPSFRNKRSPSAGILFSIVLFILCTVKPYNNKDRQIIPVFNMALYCEVLLRTYDLPPFFLALLIDRFFAIICCLLASLPSSPAGTSGSDFLSSPCPVDLTFDDGLF